MSEAEWIDTENDAGETPAEPSDDDVQPDESRMDKYRRMLDHDDDVDSRTYVIGLILCELVDAVDDATIGFLNGPGDSS